MFKRKLDIVPDYVKGKKVLIIGFLDHKQEKFMERVREKTSEFAYITEKASEYKAIDIADADYEKLRSEGFNVYQQNILEFNKDFENEFDAITAVNIVDHIDDLSSFYKNAKMYLKDGGKLIIRDDDPTSIDHFLSRMKGKWHHNDNMLKITPGIVRNHAERYGYKVEEISYVRPKTEFLDNLMPKSLKNSLCRSFIAVLKK